MRNSGATDSSSAGETLDLSAGALLAGKGRETKQMKAIRLLVTGRLRVFHVSGDRIAAEIKGDSGELYQLGWNGRWFCGCKARTDCSHLMALQTVTAVARG